MHLLPKVLRKPESFDLLLSAHEGTTYGFCIQDIDHVIIHQSTEHQKWFGNYLGRYCYEIHAGSERACYDCAIERSVDTDSTYISSKDIEVRGRWYEVQTKPLFDANKKCIGGIEIVKDITATKNFDIFFTEKFNDVCFAASFRISVGYALFSVLWITLSDSIVHVFVSGADLSYFVEMTKGILFIILTSIMLFMVLYKVFRNVQFKEIALAKSEKKYHSIVELSPDAIISHKRGIITYINSFGITMLGGNSAHDFIGQPIKKFIVDSEELLTQMDVMYKREGSYINAVECKMRTIFNDTFDAEVSSCSYNNGFEIYAQSVIRDVTERNKIQEQLRVSEKILSDMVENMRLIALSMDTKGNIQFCNDYFCKLVGDTKYKIIGNNWYDDFVPRDVRDQAKADFKDSIKADSIPIHAQSRIITRTGIERTIYWNNTIIRDNEDNLTGITSIGEDITDTIRLENTLKMKNIELIEAYDTTLQGWSKALDLRDHETEGHSQRVTEWSVELAMRFGLDQDELLDVRRGALLHDIGKMGVPDLVLLKSGPLNETELEIMKRHPSLAHDLLSPITFLGCALNIPYCHHERWDGLGYPRQLRGADIPLIARIFSVIDVYDALSSDRPYRPAWDYERVIQYLLGESGKMFDPKVVEVFLEFIKSISPDKRTL